MSKCKRCTAEFSLFKDFGDGLCPDCHKKAVDEWNEQKKKDNKETKDRLESLVKVIAGSEDPIYYTTILFGLQKESSGFLKKLPGMATGLLMGGVGGEMLFGGTMTSDTATYSAEVGLLVVTATSLLIGHTKAPMQGDTGSIGPDHIKLLIAQAEANSMGRLSYKIAQTQVRHAYTSAHPYAVFTCGEQTFSFRPSILYVNGELLNTMELKELCDKLSSLGSLATPADFVKKMLADEKPLADSQIEGVIKDKIYMEDVAKSIMTNGKRDLLVKKLVTLEPSVRAKVEDLLRDKGALYEKTLFKMKIWGGVWGLAAIGSIFTEDFDNFLCVVAAMTSSIVFIVYWINLNRSKWCRKVMSVR